MACQSSGCQNLRLLLDQFFHLNSILSVGVVAVRDSSLPKAILHVELQSFVVASPQL